MRLKLFWLLALLAGLGLVSGGFSRGFPGGIQQLSGAISPPQAPASLNSVASSSCYTWDFLNNTGQDVTGLVIHLKGIPAVSDVYTGVLNPFGAPDPSSGYDPAANVYSLVFSGGFVADSGMAQVGICAGPPALRLDTTLPAFYWVAAGAPLTPAPLFAGLDFNWIDANHLQVHLYNEQSVPLTAFSLVALSPPGPLTLDDQTDQIAAGLPMVSDQIADPIDMAGMTSLTFDIFLDQGGVRLLKGAPLLLEATLAAQDDPANGIHLLVQTSQPLGWVFLPIIER